LTRTSDIDVLISEVGPRDGLQSVSATMTTENKLRWIAALADAGVREIEVGSFVPARSLPQLADTAQVVVQAQEIADLTVIGLAPNARGVADAIVAGVHTVSMPVSASESHNLRNLGRTCAESVEQVKRARELVDAAGAAGPRLDVGVSTAFGCTIEGKVSEDRVIDLAVQLADAGAHSVGLSDTTGYANPASVRRLFARLSAELGDRAGAAHLHNTRGQGLANVVAALDAGVRTFDSSQAGLGGCPWAPGATGNIVTEDLVFLLEAMGLRTGIDVDALNEGRKILREALPGEPLYGSVPDAGLPLGFEYAGAHA